MKMSHISVAVIAIIGLSVPACAQRDPRTPRTSDGKPNLTAPAPRLNGKPDLSGLWQTPPPISAGETLGIQGDASDVGDIHRNVFYEIKPSEEPLKPEAIALVRQRLNAPRPQALCLPMGAPSFMMVRAFKLIQTPQQIVMIGETPDPPRQIYLDGRALPKDPDPTWLGYSVGKWDGDTLVVQTRFHARCWAWRRHRSDRLPGREPASIRSRSNDRCVQIQPCWQGRASPARASPEQR